MRASGGFSMARRLSVVLVAFVAAAALAGDKRWEQPKDGVFTEKQVDAYLGSAEKLVKFKDDLSKWLETHKDDTAGQVAKLRELDGETKKIKDSSGLDPDEYEWVSKEVNDIWVVWHSYLLVKPEIDKKAKDADDKVAAAQKAKDDATAARKAGKRVMTPEEKADARKNAEESLKDAESGLKDAKQATADAKKALDDAKAALKAADGDGKADAEQAVKDRQEGLKGAQDAEAEAQKNVDTLKKRAKDPDAPTTPEEKADVERDLAEREQRATDELAAAQKEREAASQVTKMMNDQLLGELKKHPEKNVEIVKAREKRIEAMVTGLLGGKPAEKKEEKK
jgi:hypothetical protein